MTRLREIFQDNGPDIDLSEQKESKKDQVKEVVKEIVEPILFQIKLHRPVLPSPHISMSRMKKMRSEVRAQLKSEFLLISPHMPPLSSNISEKLSLFEKKKKEYKALVEQAMDVNLQLTRHKGMFARNLAALDHKLAKL